MNYEVAETRLIEVLREAFPDKAKRVNAYALHVLESMAERLGLAPAITAYLEVQFHVSHLTELPAADAERALEFIERLSRSVPDRGSA